jgi:hypothetical protein
MNSGRRVSVVVLIGALHVALSRILLPWTNAVTQRWFDTGAPRSFVEIILSNLGLVLSFPFAFWSQSLHPARVNPIAFTSSVLLNGIFWASALYLVLRSLNSRPASNKRLERTRR